MPNPDLKKAAEEAGAKAATKAADPLLAEQTKTLDDIGPLRLKIIDGTATGEEKQKYDQAKKKLAEISAKLDLASQVSSEERAKLKAEYIKTKLDRLSPDPGTLDFAKAENLFEYVLRTQQLNPYSRERACDLEFMNLMVTVGADATKEGKEKLDALKQYIKDSIK